MTWYDEVSHAACIIITICFLVAGIYLSYISFGEGFASLKLFCACGIGIIAKWLYEDYNEYGSIFELVMSIPYLGLTIFVLVNFICTIY